MVKSLINLPLFPRKVVSVGPTYATSLPTANDNEKWRLSVKCFGSHIGFVVFLSRYSLYYGISVVIRIPSS